MNNHASLYILLSFIGVAGILVLVSIIKNKRNKNQSELAPKIPFTWDIPRYNDVEERFIKLKNVWFRMFCLVVGLATLFKGIESYHREPLKDLPVSKAERIEVYKAQVIKLSLGNIENLTKKQVILDLWIGEHKVCKAVEVDSRKYILDNYKKSPAWMIENKAELIRISSNTCEYVRGLSRALLNECTDSACLSKMYNQIIKYNNTGDWEDKPKVEFNFEKFSFDSHPQEVKAVFSYIGWYLNSKEKR